MKFTLQGDGPNRWNSIVSRGQVQGYHDKPHPVNISGKAKRSDIAGLKKIQKINVLESADGFRSRFTIGFEVEKNALHRGAVREYELFCGFERDGSCGYEAVTHILPLIPSSGWKTAVFDMMHKASRIIEDTYSPSNSSCGGHTTISVDGLSGEELRAKVRLNSGILYALFRNRLKNSFCSYNLRMQSYGETNSHFNGWHSKYQLALVKNECLEYRLPSRFQSVKQMMRRYELMYELVDYSINKPNGSFNTFLKSVRPIILSMYNGEVSKADEILELAKHFQVFIITGRIHEKIERYIR